MIRDEKLEVLHPEFGTKPSVYYKNMYRFDSAFVAGSVAYQNGKVVDCAEGAKVTLTNLATKETKTAVTDMFGDFKFDGLPENSGKYKVDVEFNGTKKSCETDLKLSTNIGLITF
jgi:hypothetical protein